MKSVKMFLGMMIFLCALASQAQAVILDFETLNTVCVGEIVASGADQSPKVTFSQDWETGIKKGNDYIVEFSVEDELIGLISFDSGIDSLTLEYSSTATEAYVLIYDSLDEIIKEVQIYQNVAFQILDLSAFSNIFSIGFKIAEDASGSIKVDNISYKPVPVPAAALLLGAGLLGIVGVRRRQLI